MEVCRTLRRAGHQVHLVGGAVRDISMPGRPDPTDWDLATSAMPGDVQELFPRTIPIGKRHGTITVVHGGSSFEVTTYRGEATYTDGRHPDAVTFLAGIEGDLARRDFTFNAMALDPETGNLLDPHGGLDDLEKGLLRTVGDPIERFSEDGLRIMRAARFAAVLELEPSPDVLPAMVASRDVFLKVSAERKRDELIRLLEARQPSRGLELLMQAGCVALLFPGLELTAGCLQGGRHLHDVWTHTMKTVDACPRVWRLRLAALLHDAGKPDSACESGSGERSSFIGHEKVGADLSARWLRNLRLGLADAEHVIHLVRHHMVLYDPSWSDAAVRRFVRRVGADNVDEILHLAAADVRSQGLSGDLLPLVDELRSRASSAIDAHVPFGREGLVVNGHDLIALLGMSPGPEVGRMLDALLEEVTDDPSINVRDRLIATAKCLIAGSGRDPEEGGGKA